LEKTGHDEPDSAGGRLYSVHRVYFYEASLPRTDFSADYLRFGRGQKRKPAQVLGAVIRSAVFPYAGWRDLSDDF